MESEPSKEKKWRSLLKEFKTANLPISKFCELHNVSFQQFYYWRGKIENITSSQIKKNTSFIKVQEIPKEAKTETILSIEINNIKINVPIDFNTIHLKKIIRVVQAVD